MFGYAATNELTKAISTAIEIADNLSFCKLDLLHDDGWDAAMENYLQARCITIYY